MGSIFPLSCSIDLLTSWDKLEGYLSSNRPWRRRNKIRYSPDHPLAETTTISCNHRKAFRIFLVTSRSSVREQSVFVRKQKIYANDII